QAAAKKYVERYDGTGSNPTALMLAGVEPGTGRIQLMATNRVYSNDDSGNGPNSNPQKRGQRGTWPNTTNPLISGGGDVTGYQAGSSFKVFTLVAALEQNVPLNHTINATSPYVSNYIIDPHSPAACNGDHYCPVNANPPWMNGPRNMWTGLGRSVNTYWVPLEWEIGAENAVSAARQLGIQFRASNDARLAANAHQWGAFTLGVSATTPLDMANAYATLGADGNQTATLVTMTRQLSIAGIVADADWACTTQLQRDLGGRDPHAEVVNPAVAWTLHDAMVGKPAIGFPAPPATLAFGPSGKPSKPDATAPPAAGPA